MPLSLTAEQRTLRARNAALTRWSKEHPSEQGRVGQAGLLAKFEAEVDPDGVLPAAERLRRAEALRRAHMTLLALKSSRARGRRKAGRQNAAVREA